MTIKRMHSGPRMSQVVVHGNVVYLAGQVAQGAPGGSITEQTLDILSTIDRLLAEAGSDKSRVLSATIWPIDTKRGGGDRIELTRRDRLCAGLQGTIMREND
jgi:enamine deaminase RidA (YjgF/YER057c/UK114 family)